MTGRVAGKVALVTGAASGIGRATALLLAREGARVIASDQAAVEEGGLLGALGADAGHAYLALDVADEQSWIGAIAEVRRRFGRLDILVNNAGVALAPTPVTDLSLDAWRRVFAVNAEGVFLGVKHALPLLRDSGGGSIVNLSSIAGIRPSANASAYAASKGAVRLFTKAVALECAAARDGVRVNSIHPGLVETPIWDELLSAVETPTARTLALEAIAAGGVPLARAARAEEIAQGVVWLACDESSYMTGGELVLDGGRTIA